MHGMQPGGSANGSVRRRSPMKRRWRWLLATAWVALVIWLVSIAALGSRHPTAAWLKTLTERPPGQATENDTEVPPILIGLPWPEGLGRFLEGAELAVREINEAGGVRGHRFETTSGIDASAEDGTAGSVAELASVKRRAIDTANDYVERGVFAVVGHHQEPAAVPSANVYERNGVLFLSPAGTENRLTTLRFEYVFRLLPNNTTRGQQLARFASNQGYRRVAILSDRTQASYELVDAFAAHALDRYGMEIGFTRSFFTTIDEREITRLAVLLRRAAPFDVALLITDARLGLALYVEARRRGVTVPVIGTERMDTAEFWEGIRAWSQGETLGAVTEETITVPTVFNTNMPEAQRFLARYDRRMGAAADRTAALAYDAINLIAHGLKRTDASTPIKVADELRYMYSCQGVAGPYLFSDEGEVTERVLHFKRWRDDRFQYFDLGGAEAVALDLPVCNDLDRDNDNVFDNFDQCPNDVPERLTGGVYLEGPEQGCPVDSDGDTVPDFRDQCPNDVPAAAAFGVGPDGCPGDRDGDGVLDFRDRCPNSTPASLRLGRDDRGCPVDSDGDRVADIDDQCPDDLPETVSAGVNLSGDRRGCPVDRDGDGVATWRDACPGDGPERLALGVDANGCPVDTDTDGVIDVVDQCPEDAPEALLFGVAQIGERLGCPVDSDGDTVPDYRDVCRNDPPDAVAAGVSAVGCPQDSDGDTVPDYRDACRDDDPVTLQAGVNASGCPLDSDGDRVPDYRDACPENGEFELTAGVDARGCPVDRDGDGVIDAVDACPGTTLEALRNGVDPRGCPIDSDGDAVPDVADACPTDTPERLARGVNAEGCPSDSDGDGVPDYADACARNTPEAIAFGVDSTGCPADGDGDRVPDFRDDCPDNEASQLVAGVTGQGCPVDGDGDGVPTYRDTCPSDSDEVLVSGVDSEGCPLDSDGDGAIDAFDRCPANTASELAFGVDPGGCPLDTDGDGVADYADRCPRNTDAQLAFGVDSRGCPEDRDRDQVPDYRDRCPANTAEETAAGVTEEGCPLDSDGDGVADFADACPQSLPDVVIDDRGCGKTATRTVVYSSDINFAVGKDQLNAAAEGRLKELVATLDMAYVVRIVVRGHTDDIGSEVANRALSRRRAENVRRVLVAADVPARLITSRGLGEAEPVATNDTEAGRARNRRFDVVIEEYIRRIDSDGDTVFDAADACPTDTPERLAAGIDARGCPVDRDGDEVIDVFDACPEDPPEAIAFGVDSAGCPADRDGDGVADFLDDCPDSRVGQLAAGVTEAGCPRDADADGVPEYRDACPETIPGVVVDARGCGVIVTETIVYDSDASFAPASATLNSSAQARLRAFLGALEQSLVVRIRVLGHTDAVGTDAANLALSQARAASVRTFLIAEGLPARLVEARGRGERAPVASNATEEGRAANRRFELIVEALQRAP